MWVDLAFYVDSGGVREDGRVFLDGGEFSGVVDVFYEVTGVVLALGGVFWSDSVV